MIEAEKINELFRVTGRVYVESKNLDDEARRHFLKKLCNEMNAGGLRLLLFTLMMYELDLPLLSAAARLPSEMDQT